MADKPAQKFEDLAMWKKSHALVLRVYKLTRSFPKEEIYGLTAQMRRAATSVPANIAEGFKKRHRADKARVLNIAQGSLESFVTTSFFRGTSSTWHPRRHGTRSKMWHECSAHTSSGFWFPVRDSDFQILTSDF